jgi:hypothetical protein
MSRPTSDDCYSRAKGAMDTAESVASSTRSGIGAVEHHLMVAQGWQQLAESLEAAERASRRGRVTVNPNTKGAGA